MKINFIEETCPKCGAKTKEACNTWAYGTPIKSCQSCGTEYLDKRWREVAIDGFEPRSINASLYLKGTIVFLLFTIFCTVILIVMINTLGHYPDKLLGCIIAGALGTILCLFLYLRIKLGFESKNNTKFLKASEQRLQDKAYISKLQSYGYNIPEKYIK